MAQTVKNLPGMLQTWVWSLGWEDPLEKGIHYPLQYSCLENSIDKGAWRATVHGVTKSQTRLMTFTFTFKVGRDSRYPPMTGPFLEIISPGLQGVFIATASSSQQLYPSQPKTSFFFFLLNELDNCPRVIMGILICLPLNHVPLFKL